MVINNQISAAKINLLYIVTGILFVLTLVLSFIDYFTRDHQLLRVVAGALLAVYCTMHILDLHYIYYSDGNDKILLRFFYIHIGMRKKKAIEIQKSTLVKFEIEKSLFGLRKELILHQQVHRNVYKYPAVSITALSKKQQENLIASLKRLCKKCY